MKKKAGSNGVRHRAGWRGRNKETQAGKWCTVPREMTIEDLAPIVASSVKAAWERTQRSYRAVGVDNIGEVWKPGAAALVVNSGEVQLNMPMDDSAAASASAMEVQNDVVEAESPDEFDAASALYRLGEDYSSVRGSYTPQT